MGYIRAEKVLPAEVVKLVQQYVDGQSIYIPRREDRCHAWGDGTDTRQKLDMRNEQLFREYLSGASAEELAGRYFLTEKSIRRIIRNVQRKKEAGNFAAQ